MERCWKALTEVEVSPLIFGLEEASSGLSVNISALLHQQLHILFAAPFDGDMERCLTWKKTAELLLLKTYQQKDWIFWEVIAQFEVYGADYSDRDYTRAYSDETES